MNSFQAIFTVVIATSSVTAQFGGLGIFGNVGNEVGGGTNTQLGRGFEGSQQAANFLDGASRFNLFNNVGVNGQLSNRAGVDALGQNSFNENLFASNLFGERAAIAQNFGAEEIAHDQSFSDVGTVENSKGDRTLGITVLDQQAFDVGTSVSVSQGEKNNAGARVGSDIQVEAQNQAASDIKAAAAGERVDGVQALAERDEGLRAIDQFNRAQSERLQSNDQISQRAGGNENFFGAQGFGAFDNLFGRRRRR